MEEEETPEQTDEIVEKADLSEFSFSVRTAVRGLEDKQISSWTIVQRLAELHPEYGDGLAKILSKERGPAQVVVKPVYGWLAEVRRAITKGEKGSELSIDIHSGSIYDLR